MIMLGLMTDYRVLGGMEYGMTDVRCYYYEWLTG